METLLVEIAIWKQMWQIYVPMLERRIMKTKHKSYLLPKDELYYIT